MSLLRRCMQGKFPAEALGDFRVRDVRRRGDRQTVLPHAGESPFSMLTGYLMSNLPVAGSISGFPLEFVPLAVARLRIACSEHFANCLHRDEQLE